MRLETQKIYDLVCRLNQKKGQWSFLTSIEYMLQSNIYMDGVFHDANIVTQYIKSHSKILDFGTGSGIFAVMLAQIKNQGKIFGLDAWQNKSQKDSNFNDTATEQTRLWKELGKTLPIIFQHYNGLHIPFSDNTFDIITAYAVIEHIDPADVNQILKELKRVLKKDGTLFIFKTPRKLAYTEHLLNLVGMPQHEILFQDSEIRTILQKNKFEILKHWHSNFVPEFPGKMTNHLYPFLKYLDYFFSHSPFQLFSHHNNFILKKI